MFKIGKGGNNNKGKRTDKSSLHNEGIAVYYKNANDTKYIFGVDS